jgi:hypothetical protein
LHLFQFESLLVGTLRIFASNSWIFGVENCIMVLPKHNLWGFYHVKRLKIFWFVTVTCLVIGGILRTELDSETAWVVDLLFSLLFWDALLGVFV